MSDRSGASAKAGAWCSPRKGFGKKQAKAAWTMISLNHTEAMISLYYTEGPCTSHTSVLKLIHSCERQQTRGNLY